METGTSTGRIVAGIAALGVAAVLAGCGGSTDGSNGNNGKESGTVTDDWAEFCIATFTKDTELLDFGEPAFTAQKGEKYLLTTYGSFSSELMFLSDGGPETFEIPEDDAGGYPFTSNCEPDTGVTYSAVFS